MQRLKTRDHYLSNQLKVIHSFKFHLANSSPATSVLLTSDQLISWLKNYELKHNEPVLRSARGQLFLSLDSLGSSELKNYIQATTGVLLEDTFIWEFDTVEKLLNHVLSEAN